VVRAPADALAVGVVAGTKAAKYHKIRAPGAGSQGHSFPVSSPLSDYVGHLTVLTK